MAKEKTTKKAKVAKSKAGQKRGAVKKTFYPSEKVYAKVLVIMKKKALNFSDAVNQLIEASLK